MSSGVALTLGQQEQSSLRDARKNVEINVGKSCNNKCVFCLDGMPSTEDKQFMDFSAMQSELERFRGLGFESVGFLGGEPTTYPRIRDSIAYARQLGYTRVALATNAMMFRRMSFVDELVDAGLTRVTISMHGHTAALEDRLTEVPGGFEKKCQAIENLRQRQGEGKLADGLSVNIVLNGWNYRALPKMLRFFFEQMGLQDLRVNSIRPEGYAVGNADLTPALTDVMPWVVKAVLLNEYHFRRELSFGGFPLCVFPPELLENQHLVQRYLGDVYRDLSTSCSVRTEGVDTGVTETVDGRSVFNWQARKRYDLKTKAAGCSGCRLDAACEGLWSGYADLYGTSELSALRLEAGRLRRSEPMPSTAPRPSAAAQREALPRRLRVIGV